MTGQLSIKELIDGCNSAIMCQDKDDIYILADMVERIYPGYGKRIRAHGERVSAARYAGEFCIRIDYFPSCIDIGHAGAEWYRQKGRKIVHVRDISDSCIELDLGEIETEGVDVSALLFGVMKS